jgi:hypothetical protein
MLSANDWELMRALAANVRADRSVTVDIRRGETVLDPQDVRIEAVSRGFRLQSDAAREANSAVVIFGAMDLNIAVEDRLTVDDVLYRVVFVSVNRDIDTQAEAVGVE